VFDVVFTSPVPFVIADTDVGLVGRYGHRALMYAFTLVAIQLVKFVDACGLFAF